MSSIDQLIQKIQQEALATVRSGMGRIEALSRIGDTWIPEEGEAYWTVTGKRIHSFEWCGCDIDVDNLLRRSVFRTREEAEASM